MFKIKNVLMVSLMIVLTGGVLVKTAEAVINSLDVTYPTATNIYVKGNFNINWTVSGDPGDLVDIYYSTNDFAVSTKLTATGIPYDAGIYSWDTISAGVSDGASYKIKVKSTTNEVNGISANTFTIDNTAPAIPTVLTPNGGEVLKGGDTYNITWTPTSDTNLGAAPITIEYALNGVTFAPVATNEANDGSYTWTIPADNITSAKIRVTATDLAGNTTSDVSDVAFTIDSASPTAAITYSDADGIVKVGDTLLIIATFNEPVADAPVTQIALSAPNAVALTDMTKVSSTVYTYAHTVGVGDGTVTVSLGTGTDTVGNAVTNTPTSGATFTVDNTAPNAPTVDLPTFVNNVNKTAITLSGTGEANGSVSYSIFDAGYAHTIVGTTTANGSGAFTVSGLNLSVFNDGTITATSTVADIAGNTGAEGSDTAIKDTIALAVSSITTKDTNADGSIETALIIFNKPVDDSTFSASTFSIGGSAGFSLDTGTTTNDNVLNIVLSTGLAGTNVKDVLYTLGTASDTFGNLLPAIFSGTVTEVDGAGPVFLSARTMTTTTIDVTFSEDYAVGTLNTSGNEFTVAGHTVSAAARPIGMNNIVRLTLSTMTTGEITLVTFTSSLFEDATGNQAPSPVPHTATDGVAPVLSVVSIASNNATTTARAKVGDVVTVSFTSSETVVPTVTIAGHTASVSGGPTSWTATYTMVSGDTEGTIAFNIAFSDTSANAGTTVTATTDSLIVVFDKTAPAIASTANSTTEATSSSGATVTYTTPSATDTAPASPSVSCTPVSGSTFAIGDTTVTCTSTDMVGNVGTATFIISVVDTTVPIIASHANINAIADSLGGATITYTAPNSTDAVDGTLPALCTATSGSVFAIGVTTVNCVKTDAHGNVATPTSFTVTVTPDVISKVFVSANPTTLTDANTSVVTVTGQDQYGNTTTIDNTTTAVLSADGGGSLGTLLLTLSSGVASTTLSKSSLGVVHVNASSGALTPTQTTVTFTSSLTPDTTAPTIVSHSPADDTTDVAITSAPYIIFSEALKSNTVTSANIQLKKYSDDSTVSATVSLVEGGTKVVITPNSSLTNGTQYYFAVSTGVQDEAGNSIATALNATTKASHEFTTVAVIPIVVDEIIAEASSATADNTFLHGWHYIYRITVNTNETNLRMKFTDWLNSADATTLLANGNMRVLFNTSTGAGLGAVVGLDETNIVNGFGDVRSFEIGNNYTDQKLASVATPIDLIGLDTSTASGRQVQLDVYTKLPLTTTAGFYNTTYGIDVQ